VLAKFPTHLKRAALVLALACMPLLAACGPSAGSPDQAAQSFFDALRAADHDAAYALLSPSSQNKLSEELTQLTRGEDAEAAVARLNQQLGTSFTQSELASKGARGFFRAAMEAALIRDAKLRDMISTPAAVQPGGVDPGGTTADVEVRFANGESKVVRCERVGGGWRVRFGALASDDQ
jgi:hypothetical protein